MPSLQHPATQAHPLPQSPSSPPFFQPPLTAWQARRLGAWGQSPSAVRQIRQSVFQFIDSLKITTAKVPKNRQEMLFARASSPPTSNCQSALTYTGQKAPDCTVRRQADRDVKCVPVPSEGSEMTHEVNCHAYGDREATDVWCFVLCFPLSGHCLAKHTPGD